MKDEEPKQEVQIQLKGFLYPEKRGVRKWLGGKLIFVHPVRKEKMKNRQPVRSSSEIQVMGK